mmetsp:Transcript_18485/g.27040  ORF Transcript_18485/g.27040 Transcript_18485/m.27040 type:complete len:155 (-) Transcript_18485:368-832(-)|eukprot:CAMPEP_0195518448 /NCGR_PEP_ID=MMETSP0794_2-20130614/12912_1 /TAXON_ID=515487 /ORGANISM="Stephanopyxis turris, Strain CCMP 815" /LENGTH=154 /DNA_ID=CAMNT_0040647411 /DNA_START=91 /DNA_END=555 /DNA_ORIENTATION=+
MTFSMEVPNSYGYVILGSVIAPMVTGLYMGGPVMKARKEYNVPYPNCYATPGYHKKADEFNRVQRGHQNYFEGITSYTAMAVIGGLKHPLICSVGGIFFCLGSIFYQKGYADLSLDVKMARYKKGGAIKWIGFFGAMGSCVSLAGSMIGWWGGQ